MKNNIAFFPIPHGIVCGTLLAEATKINIDVLKQRTDKGNLALKKYQTLALLMTEKHSHQALINLLESWTEQLNLPRLKSLGLQDSNLDKIVDNSRVAQ